MRLSPQARKTAVQILEQMQAAVKNCGTGSGGFKPGNQCARGGGSMMSTAQLVSHGKDTLGLLNDSQIIAIKKYTSISHAEINDPMREGRMPAGEFGQSARILSETIQKHGTLPLPVKVFRGITSDAPEKVIESFKSGETVELKGFVSTSASRAVADLEFGIKRDGGILFEITATKGLYAGLRKLSTRPHEKELIIDNNSKFRVTKVDSENFVIHMEQVG